MKLALTSGLTGALLGVSIVALAQAPRELQMNSEIVFEVPVLPPPAAGGDFAYEMLGGPADGPGERLVKGAPYCADAVHESVQPLLDADGSVGNRIVRQTRTRLCRDGEGRTRQELERQGRKLAYLRDPVSREAWVLDAERKTARGLAAGGGEPMAWSFNEMADGPAWRDYAERVREWARSLADRARPASGRPASAPPASSTPPAAGAAAPRDAEIVAIVRRARDEAAGHDVDMRVLRLQGSGPPALPQLAVPPGVSSTAAAFAPRGAGALTSLGARKIEGLDVNGERTSWTIAAGKVGNERPIVVVRDVWTSPDLMLTVQSRDFDPRRGENNYRLLNIKRGEPDAALMKVPPDYSRSASAAGR